ncbi:MAG: hypothetical protein ACSHW0_10620 [Thalassotalea sp.]
MDIKAFFRTNNWLLVGKHGFVIPDKNQVLASMQATQIGDKIALLSKIA